MWIKLRLPASLSEQRKLHRGLRPFLRGAQESGQIVRFVLTYHIKPSSESLHFCMDIPSLESCTEESIAPLEFMKPVMKTLQPWLNRPEGGLHDYMNEILRGQLAYLVNNGLWENSENIAREFAQRQIDNASRGCKAALDILSSELLKSEEPIQFCKTVMSKCAPLNGGLWLSDAAHFCFNSLGFSHRQEKAIRDVGQHAEMHVVALKGLMEFSSREQFDA